MYTIRFWFEHGGGCLWSGNDAARQAFGYRIPLDRLPLGDQTKATLVQMETRFMSYLNWDDPAAPSPWTAEEKREFLSCCDAVYREICRDLGDGYTVLNECHQSIAE